MERLYTYSSPSDHATGIPALRRFFQEEAEALGNPRNSRGVTVWQINEEEYEAWRQERFKQTGRMPGELVAGQDFPSAAAASRHLGYARGYNRVTMLLRDRENGTTPLAEEGGVEWGYIKD